MLIFAGVAFRDAGVLVRLLLLGVMPLTEEKMSENHSLYISAAVRYTITHKYTVLIPGTGSW